ncbi:MAG TPA: hypothetical protein DD001_08740 [Microcoleaceae bacterium UBA10368]|nr:hypothetical protein [Microcoleaceae cyanobacterium UBA10368]HCV31342.1 hypothetical protein [Microcoleaceae cyanobacterium UBA9251]
MVAIGLQSSNFLKAEIVLWSAWRSIRYSKPLHNSYICAFFTQLHNCDFINSARRQQQSPSAVKAEFPTNPKR